MIKNHEVDTGTTLERLHKGDIASLGSNVCAKRWVAQVLRRSRKKIGGWELDRMYN